jgi:UDP-glucose 4-epimerase
MGRSSKQTILVTGGAGAIGSHLVKKLLAKNSKIVLVDDLSSGFADNIPSKGDVTFIEGDVSKDKPLKQAFSLGIDKIYHLAANFANQSSIDHPKKDLKTNGLGMLKVLEYALKNDVKKVLFTSSSCLYKPSNKPFTENMVLEMETPYSITKMLGEHYVTFFNKHFGLDSVIVRYFNSYGPGEYPGKYRNVIPNFMWKAVNGEPLTVTGTGNETRSFTYVDDLVEGTIRLMEEEKIKNGLFNIGNETKVTITDLAMKINKICGNKAGIEYVPRRSWDKTLNRSCSVKKAVRAIGYRAETDINKGLKLTAEWFKSNKFKVKNVK